MIYLFLATCSSAVMAIVLRMFQDSKGNRYGIILGNYLVCILISFLSLPDRSLVLHGSFFTIICGIIGGIFFVAGLVTMQTSTKLNGATLTAVFSKMGLVISLAVSIFVFGERPGPMQAAGVILVLAALVLINSSGEEQDQSGKEQAQGKTDTSKVYTSALILTIVSFQSQLFAGDAAKHLAAVVHLFPLFLRVFVNLAGDVIYRFVGGFCDVVVHDGNADVFLAGKDPAGQKTPVLSAVAGNAVFARFRFPNIEAEAVVIHDRRHHTPRGLLFEEAAPTVALGKGKADLDQFRRRGPKACRGVLGVIVIPVGRVLLLRQPETEGGVGDQVFVQGLEKAGAFQPQRLGDLLLEGLAEGRAGDTLKGELCQCDAAAGVHVLLAVRTNPSELRRNAFAVQHILE